MDYLAHYGIKGQKWGIRRYQNLDGSLTEAGKMRYGIENKIRPESLAQYIREREEKISKFPNVPEVQKAAKQLIGYANKSHQSYQKLQDIVDVFYRHDMKNEKEYKKAYEKEAKKREQISLEFASAATKYAQTLLGEYGDIPIKTMEGKNSTYADRLKDYIMWTADDLYFKDFYKALKRKAK